MFIFTQAYGFTSGVSQVRIPHQARHHRGDIGKVKTDVTYKTFYIILLADCVRDNQRVEWLSK